MDPEADGSQNDYVYPTDPINGNDYSGRFWGIIIRIVIAVVVAVVKNAIQTAPKVAKTASTAAGAGKSVAVAASKSSGAANAAVTAARTTQQATRVGNTAVKSAPVLKGYQSLNFNNMKHIMDRHAFGTSASNVSVFSKANSSAGAIKTLANQAVKNGSSFTDASTRTVYVYNTGKIIGTNPQGMQTSVVRAIVDKSGNVVTIYPF